MSQNLIYKKKIHIKSTIKFHLKILKYSEKSIALLLYDNIKTTLSPNSQTNIKRLYITLSRQAKKSSVLFFDQITNS